jgi:hypothetical protein
MQKNSKKLLWFFFIIIFLIQCNKIDVVKPTPEKPYVYVPKPNKIQIVADSSKIEPWQNLQLFANVFDSLGNKMLNQTITWNTSDSLIARVNQNGLITGNLLGEVIITANCQSISNSFNLSIKNNNSISISKIILLDSLGEGSETTVTLNPKNPLNISASANWTNYSSFDGGRTWNKNNFGTDGQAMADPNVIFNHDGVLLRQAMSWAPSPRGIVVQRSTDGGVTFPMSQAYWAYKPDTGKGNADQGFMTVDTNSMSKFLGSVYVITSDYPAGTPNYKQTGFSLLVLISRDGGKTWLTPIDISSCTNCGQEHSSSITTGPNGEVYASWWNGKNQIVFNKSIDGGITWEQEKVVRSYVQRNNPYVLTDDVRGNISIDVDRSSGLYKGRIYISAIDQNGPSGGAADAWLVSSSTGGATWSNLVYMSDGPKGAYKFYFQPKISIAPNGRIDAVWYDTRNWIGSDINNVDYDLYYSSSNNGGQSFSKNLRITKSTARKITTCPTQTPCADRRLYEYIGVVSDNNRVMPVWTNIQNGKSKPSFATIWIQ